MNHKITVLESGSISNLYLLILALTKMRIKINKINHLYRDLYLIEKNNYFNWKINKYISILLGIYFST